MVPRLGVKFLSPKALCLGVDSKPVTAKNKKTNKNNYNKVVKILIINK